MPVVSVRLLHKLRMAVVSPNSASAGGIRAFEMALTSSIKLSVRVITDWIFWLSLSGISFSSAPSLSLMAIRFCPIPSCSSLESRCLSMSCPSIADFSRLILSAFSASSFSRRLTAIELNASVSSPISSLDSIPTRVSSLPSPSSMAASLSRIRGFVIFRLIA